MKYTTEISNRISTAYHEGKTAADIAEMINVPEKSVIAKLSSLGVYKKKEYRTKRGEVPVKKEEYITRIASLMGVMPEQLESMEKVNKSVLILIEKHLT